MSASKKKAAPIVKARKMATPKRKTAQTSRRAGHRRHSAEPYVGPKELPPLPPAVTNKSKPRTRRPSPIAPSNLRAHLVDWENAVRQAGMGQLRLAGELSEGVRRDGVVTGVLQTRTLGLVQLPLLVGGKNSVLADDVRENFARILPLPELAALAADGAILGVGVGELIREEGAKTFVLRRLNPKFLQYRWEEGRFYYQTADALEPVCAGDGRWVLHIPRGSVAPWEHGIWTALGRAHITKDHALVSRDNYATKLAMAAKVGICPASITDDEQRAFFRGLREWQNSPAFTLKPGYDIKLLESNGIGYDVYKDMIEASNHDFIIAIAGQSVTVDGGAGFSNSNIHASIRGDIIAADADALSDTINRYVLPVYIREFYGDGAIQDCPSVRWDTAKPKDKAAETAAANQAAQAAEAWNKVLAQYGKRLPLEEVAKQCGVPMSALEDLPAPAPAETEGSAPPAKDDSIDVDMNEAA